MKFIDNYTSWFKGQRTRLFAFVVFVLGLLELFTPNLLSDAFGLDQQGRAVTTVGIGLAIFILRQITTTPPGDEF